MKAPDNAAILLNTYVEPVKYGNPARWVARAQLVTVEDGSPRNITSGSFFDGTIGYEGHLFEAWSTANSASDVPYYHAPVVEFLAQMTSYDEIIETAKVVAQVRKRMDHFVAVDGYPANFAEALVRFGMALGVRRFIIKASGSSNTYSECTWREMKATEAREWLNERFAAHRAATVKAVAS